jgi:bifunctional non-homologous end joining protein LigD
MAVRERFVGRLRPPSRLETRRVRRLTGVDEGDIDTPCWPPERGRYQTDKVNKRLIRCRIAQVRRERGSKSKIRRIAVTTAVLSMVAMDAEGIFTDGKGIPTFDKLHSRRSDHLAFACAFDLLMVGGEDLRHLPFAKRKAALRRLLKADRGGIQYVEHAEGHGDKLFAAACRLGLEGIVSKKLNAPYKSGPSKAWLKIKNTKAPAATRAMDGTFGASDG